MLPAVVTREPIRYIVNGKVSGSSTTFVTRLTFQHPYRVWYTDPRQSGSSLMRIILADHHPQALWALRTILQEEPEFEIAGEAVDAPGLLILAENVCSDLVLVDSSLPGVSVEELIPILHAFEPRPSVIVMSSRSEDSRRILMAGADAFVSKADSPDWLLTTLHRYTKRAAEGGG